MSTEEVQTAVAEPSTSQSVEEHPTNAGDSVDVEKKDDPSVIKQMEIQNSEFVGMGKEELMLLANRPFWVRLRWALFFSFWLLWLGLLVGAALIIGLSPGCEFDSDKVKEVASSASDR